MTPHPESCPEPTFAATLNETFGVQIVNFFKTGGWFFFSPLCYVGTKHLFRP